MQGGNWIGAGDGVGCGAAAPARPSSLAEVSGGPSGQSSPRVGGWVSDIEGSDQLADASAGWGRWTPDTARAGMNAGSAAPSSEVISSGASQAR